MRILLELARFDHGILNADLNYFQNGSLKKLKVIQANPMEKKLIE